MAPDASVDIRPPLDRLMAAASRLAEATGWVLWQRGADDRWWRRGRRGLDAAPPAVPSARLLGSLPSFVGLLTSSDPEAADDQLIRRPAGWPAAWVLLALPTEGRRTGLLLLGRRPGALPLAPPARSALRRLGRTAGALLDLDPAGAEGPGRGRDRPAAGDGGFAALHRRSAFAVHDLKSLAEVLSLCLTNAERHRQDPAFIDDLLATLRGAVDKLDRILAGLRGDPGGRRSVDLAASLRRLVQASTRLGRVLTLKLEAPPGILARVDAEQLDAVLDHLVDNALEAGGSAGVELCLASVGRSATIEVRDQGAGMAESFVQGALFTPFASTKPGGLGLGAYQARRFAEEAGGRLEVESSPGRGTIMRLVLPAEIPAPVRLAS